MDEIKLLLRTTPARIIVDSSKAREEIGFKSPRAFCEAGKALGKQAALGGIARRAQEGDRFQHIENTSNPVAEIAAEILVDNLDYNVGLVPKTWVQITVERGKVEVRTEKKKVESSFGLNLLA